MGQFANLMFNMMLGWVRSAAAGLWSLVTNTDVSLWVRWLLDNWLPLTLLLCLGGIVIDFVVYLFRWQPYRVWGRFFHGRKKEDDAAEASAPQPLFQRKWVYADGSTTVEDVVEPLQQPVLEEPKPEGQLTAPIRPQRRLARRSTPEQAYHEPVYPPQWQNRNQQGEKE